MTPRSEDSSLRDQSAAGSRSNEEWFGSALFDFARQQLAQRTMPDSPHPEQTTVDVIRLARTLAIHRPSDWMPKDEIPAFLQMGLPARKTGSRVKKVGSPAQLTFSERATLELKKEYVLEALDRMFTDGDLYNRSLVELKPAIVHDAIALSNVQKNSPYWTEVGSSVRERIKPLLRAVDLSIPDPTLQLTMDSTPIIALIRELAVLADQAEANQGYKAKIKIALEKLWPDCPAEDYKQITELPTKHENFDIGQWEANLNCDRDDQALFDAFVRTEKERVRKESDNEIRAQLRGISNRDLRSEGLKFAETFEANWQLIHNDIKEYIGKSDIDVGNVMGEISLNIILHFRARDQKFLGPPGIIHPVNYAIETGHKIVDNWCHRSPRDPAPKTDTRQKPSKRSSRVAGIELDAEARALLFQYFEDHWLDASRTLSRWRDMLATKSSSSTRTDRKCNEILDLTEISMEILGRWTTDEEGAKLVVILLQRGFELPPREVLRLRRSQRHFFMLLVNSAKCQNDLDWRVLYAEHPPESNSNEPGTPRPDGKHVTQKSDYQTLWRSALSKTQATSVPYLSGPVSTTRDVADAGVIGLMYRLLLDNWSEVMYVGLKESIRTT